MFNLGVWRDSRALTAPNGVVLIAIITVALGLVAGFFVFGIGDDLNEPAPNTQIEFEYTAATGDLLIKHGGGDEIHADQLIAVYNESGDRLIENYEFATSGDEIEIGASPGGTVSVVWYSSDERASEELASFDVPSDGAEPDDVVGDLFDVSITGSNDPDAGETLEITAVVENVGDVNGEQDVTLAVDGAVRDTVRVPLDDGDNSEVVLEWETGSDDEGTYTAEVSTNDRSDSVTVFVGDPDGVGDFTGTITDGDGDPVSNVDVTFTGDGLDETVTTDSTGSYTVTNIDDGTYEGVVVTADAYGDSDAFDVTVESGRETTGVDAVIPLTHGSNAFTFISVEDTSGDFDHLDMELTAIDHTDVDRVTVEVFDADEAIGGKIAEETYTIDEAEWDDQITVGGDAEKVDVEITVYDADGTTVIETIHGEVHESNVKYTNEDGDFTFNN